LEPLTLAAAIVVFATAFLAAWLLGQLMVRRPRSRP
jgi:hypothetical protein